VLARAIAIMVEKEKLLPVRLQVINKPGGNAAVAAAHLAEKEVTRIRSAFSRGCGCKPAGEHRGQGHAARPDPDRAPGSGARGDRGEGRRPVQDARRIHRRGEEEPGQLKQSGGSNTSRDNVVRQLLQKATGTRWAYISFPAGASASPRCSAGTSTSW